MRALDLTGERFGSLVALESAGKNKHNHSMWKCICDCGNTRIVSVGSLRQGRTISCGCRDREASWGPRRNLSGEKFGRLTVVDLAPSGKKGRIRWNCLCDCGKHTVVQQTHLASGHTKSCGCLKDVWAIENCTTHGMTGTSTYRTWTHLRDRCYNFKDKRYSSYGGRGIKVCDRWRDSFENFYADMGEKPEGMSLDRIDVNGNYEPGNCRWATWKEQSRNKTTSRFITVGGSKGLLVDAAGVFGVSYKALHKRLVYKSEEDAVGYLQRESGESYPELLKKWQEFAEAA